MVYDATAGRRAIDLVVIVENRVPNYKRGTIVSALTALWLVDVHKKSSSLHRKKRSGLWLHKTCASGVGSAKVRDLELDGISKGQTGNADVCPV